MFMNSEHLLLCSLPLPHINSHNDTAGVHTACLAPLHTYIIILLAGMDVPVIMVTGNISTLLLVPTVRLVRCFGQGGHNSSPITGAFLCILSCAGVCVHGQTGFSPHCLHIHLQCFDKEPFQGFSPHHHLRFLWFCWYIHAASLGHLAAARPVYLTFGILCQQRTTADDLPVQTVDYQLSLVPTLPVFVRDIHPSVDNKFRSYVLSF